MSEIEYVGLSISGWTTGLREEENMKKAVQEFLLHMAAQFFCDQIIQGVWQFPHKSQ